MRENKFQYLSKSESEDIDKKFYNKSKIKLRHFTSYNIFRP